jgi:hypothetical protein
VKFCQNVQNKKGIFCHNILIFSGKKSPNFGPMKAPVHWPNQSFVVNHRKSLL